MPRPRRLLLLWCLLPLAAWAGTTRIATDKPIVNFRLPEFTPEGHRSWLVRGTEARYATEGVVDIKELNLTVFTGRADEKVETLILSPAAQVRLRDQLVSGPDAIRVINDRFEASGSGWTYHHGEKKVSIARNVRVILHTQLNDILK